MPKLQLLGKYSRQGSNFIHKEPNKFILVFATRKKTTPNKPPNYLLHTVDKKQFSYVSSIYEIESNFYAFDYDEELYNLIVKADEVIIEKK